MTRPIFTPIPEDIITRAITEMRFSEQGLIAAIAQQCDSGEILMMAWMNGDAVRETLTTGRVCYWSRSRKALWRKGESSGQIQSLKHFRYDCDKDTILLMVDQKGVACHTGRRNCFYHEITSDGVKIISAPDVDPADLYGPGKE
ncbi:Phosphoribosyl-AMP cyclohydrolase [hydrothermal vent metagenome]|uniref:Histidine biosynthesis bifunctional protein HisIE n=1 Tax=hydrothermal vent metagenome TaxID=652676 RepID=A0A3B0S968_9ZZZZ